MGATTANQVADYILYMTREVGDLISNLQLQKLVYYSQAWYLAFYGEPLFDEPIEAWVHGPVQPGIYARFAGYTWQPITEDVSCPTFHTSRVKSLVKEVLDVYARKTGWELEALTHQEDPWREARGGIPNDQPSHAVITHQSMMRYYRSLLPDV